MDSDKWFQYSYAAQISNIGSEVLRAIKCRKTGNEIRSNQFYKFAIELISLSKSDPKNEKHLMELIRAEKKLILYFESDNNDNHTEEIIMAFGDSQLENYLRERQKI